MTKILKLLLPTEQEIMTAMDFWTVFCLTIFAFFLSLALIEDNQSFSFWRVLFVFITISSVVMNTVNKYNPIFSFSKNEDLFVSVLEKAFILWFGYQILAVILSNDIYSSFVIYVLGLPLLTMIYNNLFDYPPQHSQQNA